MAKHLSVVKRLRQSHKANLRNRSIKSNIKNLIKKVETSSDLKQAQENLKDTISVLDKAVRLKIIHSNTAARTKTRLSKLVNKLSSSSEEKKD
ncbi:MAG: 30S ribosomal protein S20 [Candidatus Zixiibacteriota bacterium]